MRPTFAGSEPWPWPPNHDAGKLATLAQDEHDPDTAVSGGWPLALKPGDHVMATAEGVRVFGKGATGDDGMELAVVYTVVDPFPLRKYCRVVQVNAQLIQGQSALICPISVAVVAIGCKKGVECRFEFLGRCE